MTIGEIAEIVGQCSFPDYTFTVQKDGRGEMYLRAVYYEADTVTGKVEPQLTRKWLISPHVLESELVQTAFKCVITSMEHRVREFFHYQGQPVYCPHFDVQALLQICKDDKFAKR